MKSVAVLLLLALPAVFLKAQVFDKHHNIYKAAIRINLTGLADPIDNNICVGGEYLVHPQLSVIADVAWITYSNYFRQREGFTGYMFRPALRYYPSHRQTGFLEAVFLYKHLSYRLHDWLGIDCVNGMPAYEKLEEFTFVKQVMGVSLQGGFQTNLTKNRRLESYMGLGIRIKKQEVLNRPNTCYNGPRSGFNFNGTSGTTSTFSLPMGIRVIYCFY